MNGALLLAYACGGGIPPATYEALRVYEDGAVRAVVGNAWPSGTPQDEAGSYEWRLEAAALEGLARAGAAAGGDAAAAEGPFPADSGRCELGLPGGRELAWPATAPPPADAADLVGRLRELLRETRRHPLGALAVALEPPVPVAAGAPFALGIRLINPGREPIGLVRPDDPGRVRLRVTAADGDAGGRPDLESLVAAAPLEITPGDVPSELGPGDHVTVCGRTTLPAGGWWRLDALVRLDADLPYEGERLRLECVALAGPLVVESDA